MKETILETYLSKSPEETLNFAKNFAKKIKPGDIIALNGNLGTGKTIFVKGICEAFDAKTNPLSPTFSIVNEYQGTFTIYHFDFYRIKNYAELFDIGIEDYFNEEDSISIIEWANMFNEILPIPRIEVLLEFGEIENDRLITIKEVK